MPAGVNETKYAIYRCSTRESLDLLSLHVFARAYRDAWRALHACEPQGKHTVEGLDLLIEFGGRPVRALTAAAARADRPRGRLSG